MLLAQSSTAEILNIVAPLVVCAFFGLVIIIRIMTNHQRQMAELIHRNESRPDSLVDEIRALRADNQRLEAKVDALTSAQESRAQLLPPEPSEIRLRS